MDNLIIKPKFMISNKTFNNYVKLYMMDKEYILNI